MKVTSRIAFVAVVLGLVTASSQLQGPLVAQSPPKIMQVHVHHVHLNSVNPKAAAEYYPKAFPATASTTTFNGYEAVKTGNVYLLFTKVDAPPQTELTGPQTPDHWALTVSDLAATVARLKSEGIKFLEEIHPWGNMRAAMIEGPDRVAIELVEVR